MAFTDQDHVLTCPGVIIWEAVTKPDERESKPGTFSWNLRIAVDPAAPQLAELEQLVQATLKGSEFKGVMPHGGNHPIGDIDAAKFPELLGRKVFSAGTIQGQPGVFDLNGAELQPIVFGSQLYNGAVVRLLVHAYAYNNKQKGINFGLDGVQIVDGKAPRLSIGQAGLGKAAVAAAFGGGAPAVPAPAAAGTPPPPPPAQNTSYMAPPPPPVVAAFPPAGWFAHPGVPGSYYNAAGEIVTEADLRARG